MWHSPTLLAKLGGILYVNLTGTFNPCWKMATFGESLLRGLVTPGQRGKMLVVGRPFGPLGIMLIGFVSLFLPPLGPEQSVPPISIPVAAADAFAVCSDTHTHSPVIPESGPGAKNHFPSFFCCRRKSMILAEILSIV